MAVAPVLRAPVPFVVRGAVPPRRGLRQPEIAAGSLATLLHLFFILALYRSPGPAVSVEPAPEKVTYLDVSPPPTPASARAVAARPKAVVVSSSVQIPAVMRDIEHPDRLAGFQVLLAPRETPGVPGTGAGDAAVDARDFSGRGAIGGVAGGKPPQAVPAAVAESLAALGQASDVNGPSDRPERPPPRTIGTRVIKTPALSNRDEIVSLMQDDYPEILRQAGVEGIAIVELMVDTTGRIVPGTIRVVSSTHALFASAALAVAARARFEPGEGELDGETVHLSALVRLPLRWTQFLR